MGCLDRQRRLVAEDGAAPGRRAPGPGRGRARAPGWRGPGAASPAPRPGVRRGTPPAPAGSSGARGPVARCTRRRASGTIRGRVTAAQLGLDEQLLRPPGAARPAGRPPAAPPATRPARRAAGPARGPALAARWNAARSGSPSARRSRARRDEVLELAVVELVEVQREPVPVRSDVSMASAPSALRSRTTQPCTTFSHDGGTCSPHSASARCSPAPSVPERAASASRTTRSRGPSPVRPSLTSSGPSTRTRMARLSGRARWSSIARCDP